MTYPHSESYKEDSNFNELFAKNCAYESELLEEAFIYDINLNLTTIKKGVRKILNDNVNKCIIDPVYIYNNILRMIIESYIDRLQEKYEKDKYNKDVFANLKELFKGNYCPICDIKFDDAYAYKMHISSIKHNLSVDDAKLYRRHINSKCNERGEAVETFVHNILKENKEFTEIENVSKYGSKYDIMYRVDDEKLYRQIQIKSLTKKRNTNSYWCNVDKNQYDQECLMVICNIQNNIFLTIPFKKLVIDTNRISVNPTDNDHIYVKYISKSLDDFKTVLCKYAKKSMQVKDNDIRNYLSKNQVIEYDSRQRLKKKCTELGFEYKDNEINSNDIDVFINNITIQCKTSKKHELGSSSGKAISCNTLGCFPYKETCGWNILIAEITDYPGQFYIFPKKVLIEKGIIATNSQKGLMSIAIDYPDSKKSHWSLDFLNKFEYIRSYDKILTDSHLHIIEQECKKRNLKCKLKGKDILRRECHINDKKCVFVPSNRTQPTIFNMYKNPKKQTKYKKGDFEIYICYTEINALPEFYIIPENILLEHKIIGTAHKLNIKTNKWMKEYKNNFIPLGGTKDIEIDRSDKDKIALIVKDNEIDTKQHIFKQECDKRKIKCIVDKKIMRTPATIKTNLYNIDGTKITDKSIDRSIFFIFSKNTNTLIFNMYGANKTLVTIGKYEIYVFYTKYEDKDIFYIIPEHVLIDNEIIGKNVNVFNIERRIWADKYKNRFDYLLLDKKENSKDKKENSKDMKDTSRDMKDTSRDMKDTSKDKKQ